MGDAVVVAPVGVVEEPVEWWQRAGERLAGWCGRRPVLMRRVRVVRSGVLLVALLTVVGLAVVSGAARSGLRAWVAMLYLLVVWFLLARTKSVSWAGYAGFFAVCLPWSLGVGLLCRRLGASLPDVGVGVGIAAVSEESLKLLPVALLVVLAPGRARRFGACDWLLLGWASGSAFTAVEEGLRRAGYLLDPSPFGILFTEAGSLPSGFVGFDTSVLPGLFDNGAFVYAGHGVVTALVCATWGLVLGWTGLSRPGGRGRWLAGRGLALLAAAAVLWVMVADHAAFNASASSSSAGWLDPDRSTVPAVLRRTATLLGEGRGRGPLLLVLLVAALLLDAARLGRTPLQGGLRPVASPAPTPARAEARPAASGRLPRLLSGVLAAAETAVRIVVRDVGTLVAAGAKEPGEPRQVAMGRARAAAGQLRQCRELVYALPGPGRRTPLRWRLVGVLTVAVLLVLAVRVGPALAGQVGASTVDAGTNIAGVLDGMAGWWERRSLFSQVLLGAAFAGLVVLSGGSLGVGFGLAGVATLTLDKGEGIADFTRDPVAATRPYARTATPAGVAVDAAEFALTFAPGNFMGAAAGGAVRRTAADFRRDPAGWRAARRALLRGEEGAVDPTAFSRRLDWSDPQVREQWVRDRYADPNRDMRTASARTGPDGVYQRQVAGADEVRLLGGDPPKPIWADGLALDPDRVVAVEAKFVTGSRTPMYEGRVPGIQENLMTNFDKELDRYAKVLADPNNPVGRLRIVTNTQTAAEYLGSRARARLGPGVDLDIVVQAAT